MSNPKIDQLQNVQMDFQPGGHQRTYYGAKADTVDVSLKAGRRGPVLMSDPVTRDLVSHFGMYSHILF